MRPLRYLSLCGMLGYGFPEESIERALQEPLDFIGVDAGSTDPGPYYLGSGTGFVKPLQVRRDLERALVAARRAGVPLIIGSAGGSGARPHVDAFVSLLLEIAQRHDLHFDLDVVYADISKDLLRKALREGRVRPCGPAPALTPERVERVINPVGQFGTEPIIAALENGADVVVAGRCCDTAIFAAYPIWKGFDPGLALHCAKIAECGTLCAQPAGANDSLICTLGPSSFTVEPANPRRACTPDSVAAHSLYEQPEPECFREPEGTVDMRGSVFTPLSSRVVEVEGTVLTLPEVATLKLEGAELVGYRTVTICGICDPLVIARLDELEAGVRDAVAANLKGVVADDAYRLVFRRYGLDATTFAVLPNAPAPREVGLLIEAVADTQETADAALSLARSTALHQSFAGRKTTAGNLAFPFSPSDLTGGPVYEFSLYHLVEGENPGELFPPRRRRV